MYLFYYYSFAATSLTADPLGRGHQLPRGHRFSYHENPANRFEHDFSSLPRDHRFLSWRRDFVHSRPQPARRADLEGHEAVRGHRRSFHYDDRKEYYSKQRDMSPVSRRSFDPTKYDPCDR